jgi:hypothetical protein
MKFKDLKVGQTFDFIDDANPQRNSFYARCKKVSARTYQNISLTSPQTFRVGSINAYVFHVEAN